MIKGFGKKVGVVFNLLILFDVIDYVFEEFDLVLIMSVNLGFGG